MVRAYRNEDKEAVCRLWHTTASKYGYAPRTDEQLDELIFKHPYFDVKHAFVLQEYSDVLGFICGCTGDDIPKGNERGYFTCILLDDKVDTDKATNYLFERLEASFRRCGKKYSAVTFFNPMRMPWVIPNTNGFEHNNMPGINVELQLYERMLAQGYKEGAREMAMFRDLADYKVPDEIEQLSKKCEVEGYTVQPYNLDEHIGLAEMLLPLENPDWITRVMNAARDKQLLPVALSGNVVAGFAGPVYPEPTGRGFFAGIGVAPKYQHHGLGKLLFYRLCEYEKQQGAKYMSLFTGVTNPAQNIYKGAGFETVRIFGVMLKQL